MTITIEIPEEAVTLVAARLNPTTTDPEVALQCYFDAIVRDNFKEALKAQALQDAEAQAIAQSEAVFGGANS